MHLTLLGKLAAALAGLGVVLSVAIAFLPGDPSYSRQEALWLILGNIAVWLLVSLLIIRLISIAERVAEQIKFMRRSDQVRRELFADIAHDLRTPLTAVQGYVDTLLGKQALPEGDRKNYLEILKRQAGQLRRLVDQVTDLARLDAPELRLELGECRLDELAHEVLAELRPLFDAKQLQVVVETGSHDSRIAGDPDLVRRALQNILDNAVRVSSNGGPIEVLITGALAGDVEVAVSDRGPGVPPEEREPIFERFHRGPGSDERRADGTALGLAIVRGIVELHHGSVSVESRPGGGATFRLKFPGIEAKRWS